jgi:uncharacterized protein
MRIVFEPPAAGWEINTALAPAAEPTPIPCHRCGVCCERWQPLLTPVDAERLAGHLAMTLEQFLREYTSAYPFDDEQWLLRREGAGCVFLRYEDSGVRRASCAVHAARPDVCRGWAAGLDKKECVRGIERFANAAGVVALDVLYPSEAERTEFESVRRRAGPESSAP